MTRKPTLIFTFLSLSFAGFAAAQYESGANLDTQIVPYVRLASELGSRARANVYFANAQDIFRGAQFNYVNVGFGNLTFLRRDLVASGRIPIVFARVYDSSTSANSDFGPGWMLSAAETISIEGDSAKLLSATGLVIKFSKTGDNTFVLAKDRLTDYLELRKTSENTLQLRLRTGLLKNLQQWVTISF